MGYYLGKWTREQEFFWGGRAHNTLVPCLGIESLNYWTVRVLGLESVFFSLFILYWSSVG